MKNIKVGLLILSVFLMMAVPATAADHDDHFEGTTRARAFREGRTRVRRLWLV